MCERQGTRRKSDGLTFAEINASEGFRPSRRFLFIQPDIPKHKYWDILQLRTVNAGLACLAQEKSVPRVLSDSQVR